MLPGSWSWSGPNGTPDWYTPGSPFAQMLQANGVEPYFFGGAPFVWSTGVGGLFIRKLTLWEASGRELYEQARWSWVYREQPQNVNVIAHSHALQVVLFACEAGLKVHALISVGSPIRDDVAAATPHARANIGEWTQVYSDWYGSNRWEWLGEIGGLLGHGFSLKAPLADRNIYLHGEGHSDLLRDPAQFHYWTERHWLAPFLTEAA